VQPWHRLHASRFGSSRTDEHSKRSTRHHRDQHAYCAHNDQTAVTGAGCRRA
jgi:hypothetical protein